MVATSNLYYSMATIENILEIEKSFDITGTVAGQLVDVVGVLPEEAMLFEIDEEVVGYRHINSTDQTKYLISASDVENICVIYNEIAIPLSEFDWSWKARFDRMRKALGLTLQDVADITGNSYGSVKVTTTAEDFPRNLRLAVVVWEKMQRG